MKTDEAVAAVDAEEDTAAMVAAGEIDATKSVRASELQKIRLFHPRLHTRPCRHAIAVRTDSSSQRQLGL